MASKKVNYGPCKAKGCNKHRVYQGSQYCSPKCQFADIERREAEKAKQTKSTKVEMVMVPA